MSYIFSNCKSLTTLPDISNWNTNNVSDMSETSLTLLPDISNWKTINATKMNPMFYYCNSLPLKFIS